MAKPKLTLIKRFNVFSATAARGAGGFRTNAYRRFLNDLGVDLSLVAIHASLSYTPDANNPDDRFVVTRVQLALDNSFTSSEGEIISWTTGYQIVRTAAGELGYTSWAVNETVGNFQDEIIRLKAFKGAVSVAQAPKGSMIFLNVDTDIGVGAASRIDLENFNILLYFQQV